MEDYDGALSDNRRKQFRTQRNKILKKSGATIARCQSQQELPAYLAAVPKSLPLDCPIPREAEQAMAMLEAIEQRAVAKGVPVDARIERGRTYRHALERLLEDEEFDRVVVPASTAGGPGAGEGLSGDDLVWLLRRAPAEVLILRPAPEDHRTIAAAKTGNGRAPILGV